MLTVFGLAVCLSIGLIQVNAQSASPASYAPVLVECPASSELLRLAGNVTTNNQTLSQAETDYVRQRKAVAQSVWSSWMGARNTGYDFATLVNSSDNLPTLGIAISGGGYRASLYGAGTLNGFDSRNATSSSVGTGGVLQMATYATGLSGGSWVLGSFSLQDMAPIYSLVLGNGSESSKGWYLENNLLLPASLINVFDNDDYYDNLEADVALKGAAGFNTSITDLWGRALSYHFVPGTTPDNFFDRDSNFSHGATVQWADIKSTSNFQNFSMPFPIIVSTQQIEGRNYSGNPLQVSPVPLDQTVFEFSPYEFGSYDPYLSAFANITYLGTHLNAGTPDNSTACVNYFSNFGFTIGTSSSLFNAIVNGIDNFQANGIFQEALQALLQKLDNGIASGDNDVANYPNPFQGLNPGVFVASTARQLEVVDGGEDGQNIPLNPLLAEARNVDVIIAVDGSADTDFNWPNGTSLIATSARSQIEIFQDYIKFPPIPSSSDTFVSQGLNVRPTFFGCNATSANEYPLIIYLPNSPVVDVEGTTNTTTLTLEYTIDETVGFLNAASENTYKGYQTGSEARDSNWPDCLACALMERQRQKGSVARSAQCQTCFNTYCYSQ